MPTSTRFDQLSTQSYDCESCLWDENSLRPHIPAELNHNSIPRIAGGPEGVDLHSAYPIAEPVSDAAELSATVRMWRAIREASSMSAEWADTLSRNYQGSSHGPWKPWKSCLPRWTPFGESQYSPTHSQVSRPACPPSAGPSSLQRHRSVKMSTIDFYRS